MKAYITTFKLQFNNNIQYRSAALAGIATQFFFGFVFILVYIAFYSSNSGTPPMTLEEVVGYLWLNQAFFSLVYLWDKDKDLLAMIRNGNISYELCRPQNLYFKLYFKFLGQKLANVLLRFAPIIVVALLLPKPYNLMIPSNITTLLLSFFSLIIGALLIVGISIIIHLITFYTIDEKGILSLVMVIAEILAGGLVPLPFFPRFLQIIANVLPFRYISDFPFRVYTGNIPLAEAFPNFLLQIMWLVITITIGYLITKNVTKKVIVQGG